MNEHFGKTILVVEDERLVALDLQRSLEQMGYVVPATPASKEEALAAVRKYEPDLVLMDLRLDGPDDGVATAAALHAERDVPVVFLTAYADEATVARARTVQPYGYLVKPIRGEDLRSTLAIALYRHAMETRLRQREQWFSTTLRAIGDAVIAVDSAGMVTYLNPAAEGLTGVSAGAAVGHPIDDCFRLLDERTRVPIAAPLGSALRFEGPSGDDAPRSAALWRGDQELPIEQSVAPIVGDRGEVLGAVSVFRSVVESRRVQQRLVMADRMASLGTLAAGVAHEINNPLAVILSGASAMAQRFNDLRKDLATDSTADSATVARLAEADEVAREIEMAADRVSRIISDLKRFALPADESNAPTDVRKALAWALRIVANEVRPRAQLTTIFEAVPAVMASEMRLGQVFVNLLTNAVHAIAEGSPERNEVRVRTYTAREGHAVVTIADSGCGMTPDVLRRAFEPFFTTRPSGAGTGLGLAIANGIVQSVGGTIAVDSTPGSGSVFRVTLPSYAMRAAPTPQGMVAVLAQPLRGRILVIVDEPAVLRTIKLSLAGSHQLTLAADAKTALDLLGGDDAFDLILCDWLMPDMSGAELYAKVAERAPAQAERFVFLTGGAFTPKAAEFLKGLPNLSISKPFNPRELAQAVQSVLGRLGGTQP